MCYVKSLIYINDYKDRIYLRDICMCQYVMSFTSMRDVINNIIDSQVMQYTCMYLLCGKNESSQTTIN